MLGLSRAVRAGAAKMELLYTASCKALLSEQALLGNTGPDVLNSQLAKLRNFEANLPMIPRDLSDHGKMMAVLLEDTRAFTMEQRCALGKMCRDHMNHGTADGMVLAPTCGTKLQTMLHGQHYQTELTWQRWHDSSATWDSKLEYTAKLLVTTFKLRNPDDKTIKAFIATIALCSGRELAPGDFYKAVHGFKDKIRGMRTLYPGSQALLKYPKDVSEYIRQFPGTYTEGSPPVASKLDDDRIREATRPDLAPTRNTHKRIRGKQSTDACLATASSPQQDMGSIALRYLLGNVGPDRSPRMGSPHPLPALCDRVPEPPTRPAGMLAVTDAARNPDGTAVGVVRAGGGGIDAIVKQATATLAANRDLAGKRGRPAKVPKKATPPGSADPSDDEDSSSDEEGSSDATPPVLKKPAGKGGLASSGKKGKKGKTSKDGKTDPIKKNGKKDPFEDYAWLFDAGPGHNCAHKESFVVRAYNKFKGDNVLQRAAAVKARLAWAAAH